MKSIGLKATATMFCLLLASCDQALSVKEPATVITRDDGEDACIVLIAIDADSNITINGETVSLAQLEARLKRRTPGDACDIVVRADKDAMTGTVVKIFDAVNTAPLTVKLENPQQ